jgi:NAD(P)H-flavin reductase
LRFTAKHLGDGSAALARLKVGSRVLIEGPYGRLHPGVRTRPKVLLFAAGIGVTPMRALLEALPQEAGQVTILHRVSAQSDLVLGDEIRALAAERGARYVVVDGHRMTGRQSWLPQRAAHLDDVAGLRQIVPDVAEREVYLCGAEAWMVAAESALRGAGVPRRRHSRRALRALKGHPPMRRITLWLMSTISALVLLFSYPHLHELDHCGEWRRRLRRGGSDPQRDHHPRGDGHTGRCGDHRWVGHQRCHPERCHRE